jgi:hypothetical protein
MGSNGTIGQATDVAVMTISCLWDIQDETNDKVLVSV